MISQRGTFALHSTLEVHLDPWFEGNLVDHARYSGHPDPIQGVADFYVACGEQTLTAGVWNELRPLVTGYAGGVLSCVAGDYVRGRALYLTCPDEGDFPLYGSLLGLNVFPHTTDGWVIAERASELQVHPDLLWLFSEGIQLDDLSPSPRYDDPEGHVNRTLDVLACAQRLCAEELGRTPTQVTPVTLHVEPRRTALSCVAEFDCTSAELAEAIKHAPDGWEQEPIAVPTLAAARALLPRRIHYLLDVLEQTDTD
jgi:hypothetical protein